VPGAVAGALALEEAGEDAVRVDVGYYALGGGSDFASPGTKESVVGVTLDPAFGFRGGRLVPERVAARLREFDVHGKDRPAISAGAAEHFTLPAAYPRLRDVNVYIGWFGPLSRAVQASTLAGELFQRLPGARTVMQYSGERVMSLMPSRTTESTTSSHSHVVAAAYSASGEQLATAVLEGADGYDFTAGMLAWAAQRPVEGVGALSPLTAFGLEALVEGCEAAGLVRG
jgi:hypothetical protein